MGKNKKAGWVLAGLGLLGVGLTLLAGKKPAEALPPEEVPPEEEKLQAGIKIELFGPSGRPVPHNSPFTFIEEGPHTGVATVTNLTKREGVPAGTELEVFIFASYVSDIEGEIILVDILGSHSFGPGESKPIEFVLSNIQFGESPVIGGLTVRVFSPTGLQLDIAQEPLNIPAFTIEYGATIVINL